MVVEGQGENVDRSRDVDASENVQISSSIMTRLRLHSRRHCPILPPMMTSVSNHPRPILPLAPDDADDNPPIDYSADVTVPRRANERI